MPYIPSKRMVSIPASAIIDILEAFYDANEATDGEFAAEVAQALKDEFVSARQKQLQDKYQQAANAVAGAAVNTSALLEPDFTMHTPLADPLLTPADHEMFGALFASFQVAMKGVACIRKGVVCVCPPGQTCPDE